MSIESSEIADALTAIEQRIQVVGNILDEIRTEFVWLVRNSVVAIPTQEETVAETVACAFCDADSPDSLADALKEGWTRLQVDDGLGHNYLGVCPACHEQQAAEEQAAFQKQVPESERADFVAEFKKKSDEATEPQKKLF